MYGGHGKGISIEESFTEIIEKISDNIIVWTA